MTHFNKIQGEMDSRAGQIDYEQAATDSNYAEGVRQNPSWQPQDSADIGARAAENISNAIDSITSSNTNSDSSS